MLRPPPEKKVLLILAKMFWKTELELLKTRVCVKYFVTECSENVPWFLLVQISSNLIC